jgi:predicted ABC-type ATPase
MPVLTLITGVNGSGKSTFVRALGLTSIDPDRTAASYGLGFTAAANLRASRQALRLVKERLIARQSLTLEVTLASGQPLRLLEQATAAEYDTRLVFITPGLDDTRLRIDNRVLEGGHNIADDVLERRTPRVLANLPRAVAAADLSAFFLSSRTEQNFQLIGAAQNRQLTLTPDIPASLEQALTALPAEWSVVQAVTVPETHPVWSALGALILGSSTPPLHL